MKSTAVIAIALASLIPSLAQAARYSIKDEDSRTGSHLRAEIGHWSLPADKTYEQLSAADRATLKAAYGKMPETDEPPYPLHGMKPIAEQLHRALGMGLQGRGPIFAVADVDAQGVVQNMTFTQAPSPEMARVLAWIVMREKFKPARCDGQPCAKQFPVRIMVDWL